MSFFLLQSCLMLERVKTCNLTKLNYTQLPVSQLSISKTVLLWQRFHSKFVELWKILI